MQRVCECCGSWMDCEICDDPKIGQHYDHLISNPDVPEDGSHGMTSETYHLCEDCTEAGCNFNGDGNGERCGEAL